MKLTCAICSTELSDDSPSDICSKCKQNRQKIERIDSQIEYN